MTVCFGDESARDGWLCYCVVCFADRRVARRELEKLRRGLGWRGELKHRQLARYLGRRGGSVGDAVAPVLRHALGCSCARRRGDTFTREARIELAARAVAGTGLDRVDLLILDECPLDDAGLARVRRRSGELGVRVARVRMASSRREPGLQVADLVAGEACRGGGLCGFEDVAGEPRGDRDEARGGEY